MPLLPVSKCLSGLDILGGCPRIHTGPLACGLRAITVDEAKRRPDITALPLTKCASLYKGLGSKCFWKLGAKTLHSVHQATSLPKNLSFFHFTLKNVKSFSDHKTVQQRRKTPRYGVCQVLCLSGQSRGPRRCSSAFLSLGHTVPRTVDC